MANLYLVDRPFGQNGLALAEADPGAQVVLIQDGVYLGRRGSAPIRARVYAIDQDVARRGLAGRLSGDVRVIDYGTLVDLIVASKVVNFA
jgi:sulfur relay protein TusB/DsrH